MSETGASANEVPVLLSNRATEFTPIGDHHDVAFWERGRVEGCDCTLTPKLRTVWARPFLRKCLYRQRLPSLRDFVFRHEIFVEAHEFDDGFIFVRQPKGRSKTLGPLRHFESPLLVLTGTEYAAMPFRVLHDRLCTALRGTRPRLALEVFGPDSTTTLVFEDGSKASGPPITK